MATDFSNADTVDKYSEGVFAEELSLRPVILDLVGEVKNKTIVDFGCGDGRYSIVFAQKGGRVTGIDLSEHQIKIASEKNEHPNIKYKIGSVTDTPYINDASVDIIFANMLLPDLSGAEALESFLREVKRVIKKDGVFIFSTLHPLYTSSDQDSSDKAINFSKERYFDEGYTYKADAITHNSNVVHFNETHFSLDYISKLLNKGNFLIERIAESKQIPDKKIYLPKYIIFKCRL